MKRLEFFYDFVCPYAYLASTQVQALAERAGAELVYRPVLLGGIFNQLASGDKPYAPNQMNAARARINELDLERYSALFGAPLKRPAAHPRRTVLALRAALACAEHAGAEPARSQALALASHALFAAYWQQGRDLEDPTVVAGALSQAGLDGSRAVAEAPSQKPALLERTQAAASAGVFGVPTFRVDDQLYWGQDRLDFVARALAAGGTAHSGGWPPADADARAVLDPASATNQRQIEFWYDFSSPFAYLANSQLARLEASTGARVELKPFLLGALFKQLQIANVPLFAFPEAKQRYIRQDMQRHADLYGLPFRFPSTFPLRSVEPLRLAIASGARQREVTTRLFQAYWEQGCDISDPAQLQRLSAELSLSGETLEACKSAQVKQALRDNTELAAARGLCGAPSFVVDGAVFWGQDRLALVAEHARSAA